MAQSLRNTIIEKQIKQVDIERMTGLVARKFGLRIAEDAVCDALLYLSESYDPERISGITNAPIKPFTLLYRASMNAAMEICRSKFERVLCVEIPETAEDPLVEQEFSPDEQIEDFERIPWVQALAKRLNTIEVEASFGSPRERYNAKNAKKVMEALKILANMNDESVLEYGQSERLNQLLSELSDVPVSNIPNARSTIRKAAESCVIH